LRKSTLLATSVNECFSTRLLFGPTPVRRRNASRNTEERQEESPVCREPAQPQSYSPKTVRCYPPPIGPATSALHRASESLHFSETRLRHTRFSETPLSPGPIGQGFSKGVYTSIPTGSEAQTGDSQRWCYATQLPLWIPTVSYGGRGPPLG
jgi:hypothetical protein